MTVVDTTGMRQTSNNLAKVAGSLTEQAFSTEGGMERLAKDLAVLRSAADICRHLARKQEAAAAQRDETAPLCLGCANRKDAEGAGLDCSLAQDVKEACTKRRCVRYQAL